MLRPNTEIFYGGSRIIKIQSERSHAMNINDAMNYINSFSKLGKPVKNLGRFSRIMDALGNPQDKLKFVHVAGTNGKGSTVRMLANSLTNAGYVTGEFTSPYIKVYNDRIRIDGKNITDEELCGIVSYIKPILDGLDEDCSQFEISTAAAFIYYAKKNCDIVVLEAGLGGLLDCTNIIKTTVVSVITSVSLDHTKILGDTVEKIARQKAGIIKEGRPVVLSCTQEEVTKQVIKETAAQMHSSFTMPDTSKLVIERCDHTGNKFTYKGRTYETSMIGKHQTDNALTAVEAADILRENGFPNITYQAVFDGIKSSVVPSRCQVLKADKPFIVIDGAHNPDGMRTLSEFVKTVSKSPKIMVCGMMEDKDWKTALSFISPYIDKCICVDGFAPKTVSAENIAAMFASAEISDIDSAVKKAAALAGDDGMAVIAGSLYLASAFQNML